jgi:hypothetical protein
MKRVNQKSSDARQRFFCLTPLSRMRKSLSGKPSDEISALRAGKQAENAQLISGGFWRLHGSPRWCSGAIEKSFDAHIARRFKRQGHSWTRSGAEHLAQLLWFRSRTSVWARWWQKTASAKTKVQSFSIRRRRQLTIGQRPRFHSFTFSLTSKAVDY